MAFEKVEAATLGHAAGGSSNEAILCKTTNNELLSNRSYINLSYRKASEFLDSQPDATLGEVATALNMDYASTKLLLCNMERQGLVKIVMRAHFFNTRRRS